MKAFMLYFAVGLLCMNAFGKLECAGAVPIENLRGEFMAALAWPFLVATSVLIEWPRCAEGDHTNA